MRGYYQIFAHEWGKRQRILHVCVFASHETHRREVRTGMGLLRRCGNRPKPSSAPNGVSQPMARRENIAHGHGMVSHPGIFCSTADMTFSSAPRCPRRSPKIASFSVEPRFSVSLRTQRGGLEWLSPCAAWLVAGGHWDCGAQDRQSEGESRSILPVAVLLRAQPSVAGWGWADGRAADLRPWYSAKNMRVHHSSSIWRKKLPDLPAPSEGAKSQHVISSGRALEQLCLASYAAYSRGGPSGASG